MSESKLISVRLTINIGFAKQELNGKLLYKQNNAPFEYFIWFLFIHLLHLYGYSATLISK
jgi:hypothetical protein